MQPAPVQILLVEDNLGDAVLMTSFLQEFEPTIQLELVTNGEAAISFLSERTVPGTRLPDAVVLDINLPRKNGFEVLTEIRQRPELQRLPVFMLSGSRAPEDIQKGYALGVISFITKPHLLTDFEDMVRNFLAVDLPKALASQSK